MMLTGCSKPQETTTLNIGFQKYGVLPIIKARGDLDKALKEKGVNVKWVEFPAGPQLLEGLNVGSVAFVNLGSTAYFRPSCKLKSGLCCQSTCCTFG